MIWGLRHGSGTDGSKRLSDRRARIRFYGVFKGFPYPAKV